MKKTQKLHLVSFIFNLAIIAILITGISMLRVTKADFDGGKIFLYYPVIAGCITILSSILMLFANGISIKRAKDATPKFFFNLRFISAVLCAITLGLTIYHFTKNPSEAISPAEILTFFVAPGLSLVEFIFTQLEPECRFKKTFVPFVATLLYIVAIITVITVAAFKVGAAAQTEDEFKNAINTFIPYDFFRLSPNIIFEGDKAALIKENAITLGVFVALSYVISFIIWSLNRIVSSIVVGVTYKQKDEKDEYIKKETIKTRIKKSFSTHAHEYDEGKVYHISYANRRDKTWKVKGELAGRANKIFKTQKEAIEFANELVKKNGGSIRIHSMVGRIRKDW